MFSQIKTSKENKEVVTILTRKLGLGTENIIARIAYSYSLSLDRRFELADVRDSNGKEYSKSVLFGDMADYYIGLVCVHYQINKENKDLSKYIKMHVDDGLQLLNDEVNSINNVDGFDFLNNKIYNALMEIN